LEATFDEASLVANGGLILVATLVGRLGLEALVDRMVRLGGRPGGAMPGRKVLTLVHSMIAGGSCIDDADRLRSGATGAVLGHRVMAPSTLGTFLRAFTFGHVRQLEKVIAETIRRAWAAGAGPGTSTCTLDIDSTIGEVYGHAKQGAAYGYTRVLGYHPLLATRADTGEVLHARLRKGSANTARGANRFVEELVARVRRAGADGPLIVRADSGFYNDRLLATFKRLKVGYSVTIPLRAPVCKAIEAINERAWQRIEYSDGVAQLAECVYRGRRLIVRRVRNHRGTQGELFTTWRYHGFVTNRAGSAVTLDAHHRDHARVELAIRDLKAGAGLEHFPSGDMWANAAWLACAVLAHNLIRWTATLAEPAATRLVVAKTFRTRMLDVAARIVAPAGRPRLRLPARWPWATQWLDALATLRAIPAAVT